MNAISSLFSLTVPHGRLHDCIQSLEEGLRALKDTPYHSILGHDFLHHLNGTAELIVDFFRATSANSPVGAMYFEMNEFTINPDRWLFNGFAYEKGGDIWHLTWHTDWLSHDIEIGVTEDFTLTGMEAVQEAFGSLYGDEKQPLSVKVAEDITEHLVVARFNELICAAHQAAKEVYPKLQGIPIFSTAHDWDRLCPSQ